MKLTAPQMEAALRTYEGLIFTTAQRLVASGVQAELDDVMQLLRVKAWKGLRSFDPAKARGMTQDRYVFMVVRDQAKDIAKKKRVPVLLIEDIAPVSTAEDNGSPSPSDAFHARYLSQSHDETYEVVEADLPLVPNTLSLVERQVLVLLYRHYSYREIAHQLGISKGEVASAVRALRSKLEDWRPTSTTPAIPPGPDENADENDASAPLPGLP